MLGFSQHFRLSEGEEAVEGMQGGKPLIACAHTIPACDLHCVEEVTHPLCRQISFPPPLPVGGWSGRGELATNVPFSPARL